MKYITLHYIVIFNTKKNRRENRNQLLWACIIFICNCHLHFAWNMRNDMTYIIFEMIFRLKECINPVKLGVNYFSFDEDPFMKSLLNKQEQLNSLSKLDANILKSAGPL